MTLRLHLTIGVPGETPAYDYAQDLEDVYVVRVGAWCWYRTPDGELRERVFPDANFGVVGDGELESMLRGERRD